MNFDWFKFLGDLAHDLARNVLYVMPVLVVLMAVAAKRVLRQVDETVASLQRAKADATRDRDADSTERRP
ncbi:hypothetical protein [Burkholderia metallica]